MPAKTYGALNPEQLARLFEMRADIALRRANVETMSKLRIGWKSEESTWREAAYIVRNTEFVGWTPSSRIVMPVTPPATNEASEEGS